MLVVFVVEKLDVLLAGIFRQLSDQALVLN